MSSDIQNASSTKAMLWMGRVISGLIVASLVMSAIFKFTQSEMVVKEFGRLGWSDSLTLNLGIIELACAIAYAIPQTAVLGAILVTGYLGGAVATHVRIADAFLPPLMMGVLAWAGLYLRDSRLRQLVPWRTTA